jgi:hypothetical protein
MSHPPWSFVIAEFSRKTPSWEAWFSTGRRSGRPVGSRFQLRKSLTAALRRIRKFLPASSSLFPVACWLHQVPCSQLCC